MKNYLITVLALNVITCTNTTSMEQNISDNIQKNHISELPSEVLIEILTKLIDSRINNCNNIIKIPKLIENIKTDILNLLSSCKELHNRFNIEYIINEFINPKIKLKIEQLKEQIKDEIKNKYGNLSIEQLTHEFINTIDSNCKSLKISKQYLKQAFKLIIAGVNINTIFKKENTIFTLAAYNGYIDIVKSILLISKNAIKNNQLILALISAIKNGQIEIVKFLVHIYSKNKSPNCKEMSLVFLQAIELGDIDIIELLIENNFGDIRCNSYSFLYKAIENNNIHIVKLLIDNGANINKKGYDNKEFIIHATELGHKEIVELLIKLNVDINAKDHLGDTALMIAARYNNTDIVKLLLDAKANPVLKNDHSNFSSKKLDYSALALAKQYKANSKIIKMLKDASHNKLYKDQTKLMKAIAKGKNKIIEKIINNHGADIINAEDKHKMTPLTLAIQCANKDIIKLLINNGANVNIEDGLKKTPLIKAVEQNNKSIVKLLINNGANVNVNIEDISKKTPLMKAVEQNNKSIAKLLIKYGADINQAIPYGTYKTLSPLKLALMNQNYDMAILLINAKAYDKSSFLYAAEEGYTEILKAMIENDANINIQADNGWIALILATKKGHVDIVKLLITAGIDINATNSNGDTALMKAAFYGYKDIVELLIAANINVNITNKWGKTALTYAVRKEHADIVKLLIEAGGNIS
ncbi:MAG: ankyrin repeat domain-containing protein [Novosphingobium sp.]|nr:ankyrin repeat domain-containing protein [Novosphingobium sp.]